MPDFVLAIFKYTIGLIPSAVGMTMAGLRHGWSELETDVDNLSIFLNQVYDKAHDYWMNPPSVDDHIKEVALMKDLHYVAQEVFRIHQQHKIYSHETLVRLNGRLNEVITLRMSSTRTPNKRIVSHAGRVINHFQIYLKKGLVEKRNIWRRMIMSGHKISQDSKGEN